MTTSQFPSKFLVLGVVTIAAVMLLVRVNHPTGIRSLVHGARPAVKSPEAPQIDSSASVNVMKIGPGVTNLFPTIDSHQGPSSDVSPPPMEEQPVQQLPPSQEKLNYLRERSVSTSLLGLDLDAMSDTARVLTINSFLDNVDVVCKRKLRMGHLGDGGWEMCDDPEVRPVPPCIIYSFGINRDWSFDDDVSQLYGCHVYAFDPSIDADTHNRSDLVHFYKWGLAGEEQTSKIGWQLYSFQDIRRKLGHEDRPIDIIKMDIERAEWGALPNMLETGQLDNVKQFLIEYHVSAGNKLEQLQLYLHIEKLGFGKFDVHKNEHCEDTVPGFPVPRTRCYEVHYMRVQSRVET